MLDGMEVPVSRRLWWFQRDVYFRRVFHGVPEPAWVDVQEAGISCLMTEDCNNDLPCKYARSRGE